MSKGKLVATEEVKTSPLKKAGILAPDGSAPCTHSLCVLPL